jgi:sugar/nucleoside kinase (ribokinase family)
VDTTGGGNSSSAAVLYAYCEGYEPKMAAAMGSAAAAVIISQFGVPDIMDETTTKNAMEAAKRLCEE